MPSCCFYVHTNLHKAKGCDSPNAHLIVYGYLLFILLTHKFTAAGQMHLFLPKILVALFLLWMLILRPPHFCNTSFKYSGIFYDGRKRYFKALTVCFKTNLWNYLDTKLGSEFFFVFFIILPAYLDLMCYYIPYMFFASVTEMLSNSADLTEYWCHEVYYLFSNELLKSRLTAAAPPLKQTTQIMSQ